MQELQAVNKEHERSYGNDMYTNLAKEELKKHFGDTIESTFVFNGTGANLLALATLTQSFNSILCADTSHIYVDESTAPEMMTHCRIQALKTTSEGKITPETLRQSIKRKGDEHHPQSTVLSIAQPTEYGTVYTLSEIRELKEILANNNMYLHIDGARLYHAIIYLNVSFNQFCSETGVNILSLGGTKIGLMYGEAIIFFNSEYTHNLKYIHKRSMQLASKMRFIAAQFYRLFKDELWKKSAIHSNTMAQYLGTSLTQFPQIQITKPIETNAVFAI